MERTALTVREVADCLKLPQRVINNLIRARALSAFKVGKAVRVLRTDLDSYIHDRQILYSSANAEREAVGAPGQVSARRVFSHLGAFQLLDIGFSLPIGKTLGIIGLSGSGKTLLLKTMAGLVKKDAGAFFIGLDRLDERLMGRIGYVFQDYALYPTSSRANIAFPREVAGEAHRLARAAVAEIAERLKLPAEYLDKRTGILPEGIKQLVAIGRAENRETGLFLMDEPLVHLDPAVRREMRAFLSALRAEYGATTIYAFNDPEDALALSDYLLVLMEGRVAQFGTAAEVYENPVNLCAMELLSLEGVNRLEVGVRAGKALPWGLDAPVPDGEWLLCFRPEEIEVGDGPFSAKVERIAPRNGSEGVADVRLDSGEPLRLVLPLESEGTIRFKPTSPHYFPRAQSSS